MGRIIAVFFLVLAGAIGYFSLSDKEISVFSPIPKVFGENAPKIVNTWFVKENEDIVPPYNLTVGASSALLVDFESGDVIFSQNQDQKLPAASTIKIMTALVALSNAHISSVYTVSDNASKIGENSMGLTTGEKLTAEELLYGMMLVSGNDAAVTIAEGVSGSEEAYVVLMNAKAAELGLLSTKFINATGLDVDGQQQYTTVSDMAVISHFVYENYPEFRKIVATDHLYIEATADHKGFDLYNDTNLLTTYPGVKGIKPGFTWEAGLCLVTYAENDGKKLLGVILGSLDRRGEMMELLDYGFATYGISVSHPALDL